MVLNTWDKTWFPAPFSPVCVVWGELMPIAADLTSDELEQKRVELTDTLNDLHRQAAEYFTGSKSQDNN